MAKALRTLACALLFAIALQGSVSAEEHFDPETGFRTSRYRAPTPQTAPGATTITVDDVKRLVRDENAVLLDAMPSEGAGPDPRTGVWRLVKTREHIPGSVWLPDVGRGTLTPAMEHYFKSNLRRLTGDDPARAIIIYCVADCWMGWNAVKRASAYGYTRLYWMPDGTDGWRDWEGTFEPAEPVPLTPADASAPQTK